MNNYMSIKVINGRNGQIKYIMMPTLKVYNFVKVKRLNCLSLCLHRYMYYKLYN